MKFTISKFEQIKAILLKGGIGYDGWSKRNLNIPSSEGEQYEFADIFNISEQDVYDFVKEHGWNYFVDQHQLIKIAKYLDELPDPEHESRFESRFSSWLLLPKTEQGYHLATFGSWDRALWHEWYFNTEEERDRFIIHQLFKVQKSFWGYRPTIYSHETAKKLLGIN